MALALCGWALPVALTTPVSAAAPANDHCLGAEVIPAGGPFPHWTSTNDIAEATSVEDDPYYPACAQFNGLGRTVWFRFMPSVSAKYLFTTCSEDGTATTVYDPFIAIYSSTGDCDGPFVVMFCNDDSCGLDNLQSRVMTPLVGGINYYILVWSYDSPLDHPGTALQMRIDRMLPPPNDTCASATPLTLNIPVDGTTAGAFNDYILTSTNCFTGISQSPSPALGRDVVYSFTAPIAGNYSFKVYNYTSSGRNLVIYVAASCPAGPETGIVTTCLAAANRSSSSSAEEIPCLPMAAGQQVFLIVDEQVATEGSAFTVEVNSCLREIEPNDDLATASPLSCGIEGTISNGANADLDLYALGAPIAGSRVFALVDGVAASNQGNGQDFDLRVIANLETLEFDDNANASAFGNGSPNIAGAVLNGAPAYLLVNNIFAASEPYRLYAVVQPGIDSATLEGTNRHATIATAKTAKNDYFTGSVTNGELDVYGFTAAAGELIFLSLDGDPQRDDTPINAKLELLDTCGNVLVSVDSPRNNSITNLVCGGSECPDYPGEGLTYRARRSGNYYARVSISPFASPAASSGDYLLSITKNCLVVLDRTLYAPPVLTGFVVLSSVPEGSPASVSGTVTDPNTNGTRTVLINWGDGAADAVSLSPGMNNFNASHVYGPNMPPGSATNTYSVRLAISGMFSCITTTTNINVLPKLAIRSPLRLPNGHVQMQIQGLPGVIYRIEASGTLDANPWPTVGTVTNDSSGMALWQDTAPDPERTFYRAVTP